MKIMELIDKIELELKKDCDKKEVVKTIQCLINKYRKLIVVKK